MPTHPLKNVNTKNYRDELSHQKSTKSTNHVAIMAKLIHDTQRSRKYTTPSNVENEAVAKCLPDENLKRDNKLKSINKKSNSRSADLIAKNRIRGKETQTREVKGKNNVLSTKVTKSIKSVRFSENFVLQRKEINLLRDMETRLQKSYPGKSLRVVLVETDSDSDTTEIPISKSKYNPEQQRTMLCKAPMLNHCHYSSEFHSEDTNNSQKPVCGGVNVSTKEPDLAKDNGTNNQFQGVVCGTLEVCFPKLSEPNAFNLNEIDRAAFEQEESCEFFSGSSSESVQSDSSDAEGGWDFQTGGMPLLSR